MEENDNSVREMSESEVKGYHGVTLDESGREEKRAPRGSKSSLWEKIALFLFRPDNKSVRQIVLAVIGALALAAFIFIVLPSLFFVGGIALIAFLVYRLLS